MAHWAKILADEALIARAVLVDEQVAGNVVSFEGSGERLVGYWLGRPFWGKGYATEAGRRAVKFAFETLNADTLNAGWFHDNPASDRVLEKLGFQPAGEEERTSISRGGPVRCHLVALDRATYMTRKMSP